MKKNLLAKGIVLSQLMATSAVVNAAALEEIVVTAQKREQNTQEVGIAINVLSSEKLTELGVENTEDLANYVPNLNIRKTKGENYPTVTIRGVGLMSGDTNYATSTSSTAIHLDGVYFGSPSMLGFQLFDIAQVEVLKGPQGTLYGRNSTAGSINYVTKKPQQEFAGAFKAGYDSFNVFSSSGFVTGGVSDTTALRFAYKYEKGDSYQEDLSGDNWDGADRISTRASISMEPSDKLAINASIYSGNDQSGIGHNHVRGIDSDPWVADGNVDDNYDIQFYGTLLNVDYDLSDSLMLTSLTSWNFVDAELPDEADGQDVVIQEGLFDDRVVQVSQELRLTGQTERLNWTTGLYYFGEETDMRREVEYFQDFYYPGDFTPGLIYSSSQDTDAYAVFGQLEYALTEKLNLIAGLRWSKEEKSFEVTNLWNNFIGDVLGDFDVDPETGYRIRNLNATHENDWDDISHKLGLNYQMTDDVLLYASYSNGFKSGGYLGSITITPEAVEAPADPEDLDAYEIGVKSILNDGKLRVNFSAFYYDYKDMQAESIVFEGLVSFQTLVNVQEVSIDGFDLDVTYLPTEDLELNVSVGYTNGDHDKFITGAGDFSGTRILNAPEWSGTAYAKYRVGEAFGGEFDVIGSFSSSSDFDFNFTDRSLKSASYNMVDARINYTHLSSGVTVSLWGKNLADEVVLVHAFERGDGNISELFLPPRRIGLSVEIPF